VSVEPASKVSKAAARGDPGCAQRCGRAPVSGRRRRWHAPRGGCLRRDARRGRVWPAACAGLGRVSAVRRLKMGEEKKKEWPHQKGIQDVRSGAGGLRYRGGGDAGMLREAAACGARLDGAGSGRRRVQAWGG
jgi:hypothetical protein